MDNSDKIFIVLEGIITLLALAVGVGLILVGHFYSAKFGYFSDFGVAFLVVGGYFTVRVIRKIVLRIIKRM